MASFVERHLTVNGVDTAILMAGEGSPLVFFHGGGVLEGFDCFLPLAERFRFVAPFHPGFGPSASDPAVAGMEDWVRRYATLFDLLELDRVALLGHSLGGLLAARFALEHPDRVHRLMLASPAGLNVPEHPLANLGAMSPHEVYTTLTRDPSIFEGRIPEPLDDAFIAARMREGASIGSVVAGPFDAMLEERVDTLDVPTLLLWGDDDRVVPAGHAPVWEARVSGSQLTIFPGRGHLLFHEEPRAVDLVASFASGDPDATPSGS
jgi:pimeloyl-ACP methyl ester carboxylesterase